MCWDFTKRLRGVGAIAGVRCDRHVTAVRPVSSGTSISFGCITVRKRWDRQKPGTPLLAKTPDLEAQANLEYRGRSADLIANDQERPEGRALEPRHVHQSLGTKVTRRTSFGVTGEVAIVDVGLK